MALRLHAGLTPARLRIFLGVLWLALMVPTGVLVYQTQQQLKWEAFHHYRGLADELAQRIDAQLQRLIAIEEARAYADYQFLVVEGQANFVRRSPLAQFPVQSDIPGLLGYFQINTAGEFSTPILPDSASDTGRWGLTDDELQQRRTLQEHLLKVLTRNELVARRREKHEMPITYASSDGIAEQTAAPAQRAFDKLSAPVAPAKPQLQKAYEEPQRISRKEQTAVLEEMSNGPLAENTATTRVRIFESEVDPFELAALESGHFVLFRKAWRDGQRMIQGALIDRDAFIQGALLAPFQQASLAQMSHMGVSYQGQVLATNLPLRGTLLQQVRLSAPLGDLQLRWTIDRLPAGPGARIVGWTSLLILGVLIAGFYMLYRLGMRQITLARQQQDFISAVSHELKTPLTSIRMYSEMLREGWVNDEKKREYYHFIHDESERLSRLIANVLQLARMEHNDLRLDKKTVRVQTLMDMLRSKIQGHVERAGFHIHYEISPACEALALDVDIDAFTQIVINLVDNAVKFSARADKKQIDIRVQRHDHSLTWCVRDYGPGIPAAQSQQIFQLFYRLGNELTRETVGTGIGLALVQQLARSMGGKVAVFNRQPGAEFCVEFPLP